MCFWHRGTAHSAASVPVDAWMCLWLLTLSVMRAAGL